MFTLEQIESSHSKLKSGADFPAYINVIESLGVTRYETYVTDGHVEYHGEQNHTLKGPSVYLPLDIADIPNLHEFKAELLAHQKGATNYMAFIEMCAATGVAKWIVSLRNRTCTYFDKAGNALLIEEIPR